MSEAYGGRHTQLDSYDVKAQVWYVETARLRGQNPVDVLISLRC
jgi:hypothetical protein